MKIDINNGIICISKDTTISSGVTVKRNVMLTIKKGATLTVNGGIDAGIKTVSVMGEGTLVINGHNAFTGSIFVDGPTVRATGGNGGGGWWAPEACDRSGDNGGPGGDGGSAFVGTAVVMSGSVIATGGKGGKGSTMTLLMARMERLARASRARPSAMQRPSRKATTTNPGLSPNPTPLTSSTSKSRLSSRT